MGKNTGINNYAKIIRLNKLRINYQKKNLKIKFAVQVIWAQNILGHHTKKIKINKIKASNLKHKEGEII